MSKSIFQSGTFNNGSFISNIPNLPNFKNDNQSFDLSRSIPSSFFNNSNIRKSLNQEILEDTNQNSSELNTIKKKYQDLLDETEVYKRTINTISQQNQKLWFNHVLETSQPIPAKYHLINDYSDLLYSNIMELELKYTDLIQKTHELNIKINKEQAENKEKENEIIQKNSTINKLEQYIKETEALNNNWNDQLNKYKTINYGRYLFEPCILPAVERKEDTQSHIDLKLKYDELFEENKNTTQLMMEYKDSNTKWTTENRNFTLLNNNLWRENTELKTKIKQIEATIKEMNDNNNKEKSELQGYWRKISELELLNKKLSNDNEQFKSELPALEFIQKMINEEASKRNNEFTQITKMIEDIQNKNNLWVTKENIIVENEKIIARQNTDLIQLQEKITSLESQNNRLQIQIEKGKENYLIKEKERDSALESQKKSNEDNMNKAYVKSFNTLYLQLKKSKKWIQHWTFLNNTLQHRIDDGEESKTKYKNQISKYDWEIVSFESKFKVQGEEIKRLNQEIEKYKLQEISYKKDIQNIVNNRIPYDSDNIPSTWNDTFKQAFNKLRLSMNSCKRAIQFLLEKNAKLEREKEEAFKIQPQQHLQQNDNGNKEFINILNQKAEVIANWENEISEKNKKLNEAQIESVKWKSENNWISKDIANITEIVNNDNNSNANNNCTCNTHQSSSTKNQSGGIDIKRNKDFTQCMNELRKATKIINYLMKQTMKK